MCLAVPGRVLSVEGDDDAFLHGKVDFSGIRKDIAFPYVPHVKVGDYVLVHVGFALQIVDEEEAQRNIRTFEELLEEIGPGEPATP
jgi:hydrogenase expression/formation protein HypC